MHEKKNDEQHFDDGDGQRNHGIECAEIDVSDPGGEPGEK